MRKAVLMLAVALGCAEDQPVPTGIPYAQQQDTTGVTAALLLSMDRVNVELKRFYAAGGTVNWWGLVEYDRGTGAPVFQLSVNKP